MRSFIHDVPASRVIFGEGYLSKCAEEVHRLNGESVMLISGGPEAVYANQVAQDLGARLTSRFTEVVMHVPVEVASLAIEQAKSTGADVLVAVGGGSSIGMAKAVAKELHLPIVAIPTTYAGSEMTPIWGLTENNVKVTGRDRAVLPVAVIYDPQTTLSLPVDMSMASGMNAIAHLIEALYAPQVSPISIVESREGIRALATALPKIASDPSNLDARGEAMYGACLAGWALGTNGMGIHHKICHTLGGTYNLPHAQTHSAVISYATDFNEKYAPEAMSATIGALREAGIEAPTAAQGIWNLASIIGAPTSLSEFGFTEDQVAETIDIVVKGQPTNPRPVEPNGVRALLIAAIKGDIPTGSVS